MSPVLPGDAPHPWLEPPLTDCQPVTTVAGQLRLAMAEPPQKADAETPESPPGAKRRKTEGLVCGRVCIVLTADDEVTETNPKLDDVDFDISLKFSKTKCRRRCDIVDTS